MVNTYRDEKGMMVNLPTTAELSRTFAGDTGKAVATTPLDSKSSSSAENTR